MTYLLISATWVLFRAGSITQAAEIGGQILGILRYGFGAQTLAELGLTLRQQWSLGGCLAVCAAVDALSLRAPIRRRLSETLLPYYAAVFLLILATCLLGAYGDGFAAQDFVYFKY